MLTTSSKSGNSNRWGVSASRSCGPISGSSLISANVLSITSRNSATDLNATVASRSLEAACIGAAVYPRACNKPVSSPTLTETIHVQPTRRSRRARAAPGRSGPGTFARPGAAHRAQDVQPQPGAVGLHGGSAADGDPLTIQSTGMGGPSAAIVVAELVELGRAEVHSRRNLRRGRTVARARRPRDRHVGDRGGRHEPRARRGRRDRGDGRASDGARARRRRACGRRAPWSRSDLFYDGPEDSGAPLARARRASGRDGERDAVRAGSAARRRGRDRCSRSPTSAPRARTDRAGASWPTPNGDGRDRRGRAGVESGAVLASDASSRSIAASIAASRSSTVFELPIASIRCSTRSSPSSIPSRRWDTPRRRRVSRSRSLADGRLSAPIAASWARIARSRVSNAADSAPLTTGWSSRSCASFPIVSSPCLVTRSRNPLSSLMGDTIPCCVPRAIEPHTLRLTLSVTDAPFGVRHPRQPRARASPVGVRGYSYARSRPMSWCTHP